MNRIRSMFLKFSSTALALLIATLLAPNGAFAKDPKVKGSDNQTRVIAHVSFSGLSVVDMAMQKKVNDKYYLYVQHSKGQGVSIIDVSKPAQPKAVGAIPWADSAVSNRMNVAGNVAIISGSEVFSKRSDASRDDLVLWDLSNPTAPRLVQKFSGVVKWLQDERNFIYVLNGDGLWVVSEPADRQSEQTESTTYGGL